jgi:hypothetical protein
MEGSMDYWIQLFKLAKSSSTDVAAAAGFCDQGHT